MNVCPYCADTGSIPLAQSDPFAPTLLVTCECGATPRGLEMAVTLGRDEDELCGEWERVLG